MNHYYINTRRIKLSGLIAKPIIDDQYWVITDGQKKVGNVISDGNGFDVKIEGRSVHFDSTDDIKKLIDIKFISGNNKTTNKQPYPEYPTTSKVYNSIYDIQRKLHLYTKSSKSKCYHAAGWFVMNVNGNKEVTFCPKYIFIQRYEYIGPFKTKTEAEVAINIL